MSHCKVALIGAGYTAREHARAFASLNGVELCGIFSRTRPRAETLAREFGIKVVSDSIDQLFSYSKPDLVVVTVVEMSMNAVTRACFNHPWTVLMEKPPGYNLQDASDIQSHARDRGRKVLVALNRRFYSSTQAVLQQIRLIDGPRFIKVNDQQDQQAARNSGQPPTVVENWMFANSIHTIDYFSMLGRGPITRVQHVVPWNPNQPGAVIVGLEFESGDHGLYEGIWRGPGPWAVSVTTPLKRWEMRPLEQACSQNQGERTVVPLEIHQDDLNFKPGFRRQAQAAVDEVQGRTSESTSLDEAMRSMNLVEQIFFGVTRTRS